VAPVEVGVSRSASAGESSTQAELRLSPTSKYLGKI
jgi:hypothetical protein